MKKIVLIMAFFIFPAYITADIIEAALNGENTPFFTATGGQEPTTRLTGIDPDNFDPPRSTYNSFMDFSRPTVTNTSTYNSMRRPYN